MAAFGWAHITGSNINGPTNGLQFKTGGSELSASAKLTYDPTGSVLRLTGTMAFASQSDVSISFPDGAKCSGLPSGYSGNRRAFDYAEIVPSSVVAEIYGPIEVTGDGSFTISAAAHIVIRPWPYE